MGRTGPAPISVLGLGPNRPFGASVTHVVTSNGLIVQHLSLVIVRPHCPKPISASYRGLQGIIGIELSWLRPYLGRVLSVACCAMHA